MDILIAFLVIFAVALVAGVLLLVISHLFAVKEDPLQAEIRACLPSINCGACGYRGCDDYAAALAAGEAKPNLCVPGAQNVTDQISALLGVEPEPFEDVVAYVACNGRCDATGPKAEYEGVPSCLAAAMLYGGPNDCRFRCLGLGDCAKACPSQAICLKDGVALINTARCLGCGLCANACPKHIISMVPQETKTVVACSNTQKGADARKACKNACIGCKKCEKACPEGAIRVENNLAAIDYKKCTACGVCVKECPTGCLHAVDFPDLPVGTSGADFLD